MTVDQESRLREALHVRAGDVEADGRTWELVQARIRRSRQRRLVLAGAAAVAVICAVAVAVPAMFGSTTIRFDPPVADQPADADAPAPDAGPEQEAGGGTVVATPQADDGTVLSTDPCFEPASVAAVWAVQGNLWTACTNGLLMEQHSDATDRNPAIPPDGEAVVFERWEPGAEHPVLVHRGFAAGSEETVMGGGALPAFSPDGRLARVLDAGDGATSFVQVGRPFSEPEFEFELGVPAQDLLSLVWDTGAEQLAYTVKEPAGVGVWTIDLGAGSQELVLAPEAGYVAVAFGPQGDLAALRLDRAGSGALVTMGRGMLDGEDVVESVVREERFPGPEGSLFLASAGYLHAEQRDVVPSWSPAAEPSWFVGYAGDLSLVHADGTALRLGGGVDGVSANPAADLTALQPSRASGSGSAKTLPQGAALAREQAGAAEIAAVEETRIRISAAARAGDVAALGALMVEDFSYSFGHDPGSAGARAYLEADPELLTRLADLLDGPYGVVGTPGQAIYVWPRAHALRPSQWTEHDVTVLRELGAADPEIAAWRAGAGYTGLRAGIAADGTWRFLVEGD